jgi:hypothetical protein
MTSAKSPFQNHNSSARIDGSTCILHRCSRKAQSASQRLSKTSSDCRCKVAISNCRDSTPTKTKAKLTGLHRLILVTFLKWQVSCPDLDDYLNERKYELKTLIDRDMNRCVVFYGSYEVELKEMGFAFYKNRNT